jgi:hypothetical protein
LETIIILATALVERRFPLKFSMIDESSLEGGPSPPL